jgi:hypothetical protein
MKMYRGSGGIALLLTLYLDGEEWSASYLGYFTPAKKSLLHTEQKAGWTPELV